MFPLNQLSKSVKNNLGIVLAAVSKNLIQYQALVQRSQTKRVHVFQKFDNQWIVTSKRTFHFQEKNAKLMPDPCFNIINLVFEMWVGPNKQFEDTTLSSSNIFWHFRDHMINYKSNIYNKYKQLLVGGLLLCIRVNFSIQSCTFTEFYRKMLWLLSKCLMTDTWNPLLSSTRSFPHPTKPPLYRLSLTFITSTLLLLFS